LKSGFFFRKSNMSQILRTSKHGLPWWRFGMVWMVVAGPVVVVVAGLLTFYIAARNPDPVLQVTPRTAAQERQGITHAPAMQGRNHAATGQVPAMGAAPVTAPSEP
jgi:uncharacterized protein